MSQKISIISTSEVGQRAKPSNKQRDSPKVGESSKASQSVSRPTGSIKESKNTSPLWDKSRDGDPKIRAEHSMIFSEKQGESDFDSKNILQSFLIKTNIEINLDNLANILPAYIPILNLNESFETCRSGTIIALKYKNIVKGQDYLFKTKIGFKNTCHLIICYTLKNKKRIKKMVHIKITAVTFQVVGIPVVDVEKIIYKVFLLLEKINKRNIVFKYISTIEQKNRLEIVIVPILNNYMLTLNSKITNKIFQNSKVQILHKFIINNFISFMVPNDPAITIKKIFLYKDFCKHPIPYITWNKKFGQTIHYIEYDSYTTLLNNKQKVNAQSDKYLTLRLHSSGKVLVSGFDETLVKEGVEKFLTVCRQF